MMSLDMDGEVLRCDFWDTAGQETFQSLVKMAYQDANVCLLAFDLTNPDSLLNLEEEGVGWVDEITSFHPGKAICSGAWSGSTAIDT